jgi:flagellar motor switch protein FliN/FliY
MSSSPTSLSSSDAARALHGADAPHPLAGMMDVVCRVDVVLGTGSITVRDCLKLQRQSVIRLNQPAGADLEVRVHGVSAAMGEVVIVDDSTAIRVTDIVSPPGIDVAA